MNEQKKHIRILIVDHRELFRCGLAKLLKSKSNFNVVGTCSSAMAAVEKVTQLEPNVILLDAEGLEGDIIMAIRRICELAPEASVLLLSDNVQYSFLFSAIQVGAKGYISKDSPIKRLMKIIELIAQGEIIISSPIREQRDSTFSSFEAPSSGIKISKREAQILRLTALGFTNKQIATSLFISENTAKVHMHNIMYKMHVQNRQQAVTMGVVNGIIPSALPKGRPFSQKDQLLSPAEISAG